jgi:AcrR family transcriptional regulator
VSSTRERILGAARQLVEARPDAVPSMAAVARAAGISRQALYLHFADRPALLLALVEYVDDVEDLATGIARVEAAPDGSGQVRAWVQMQARRNPRIASLARALDRHRHDSDAATQAWRDRSANRLRGATAIVRRLRAEGRVHPTWTAADATTLLWELTSFRVWDDLVNEAGLPPERYEDLVTTTALAALAAPVRRRRDAR